MAKADNRSGLRHVALLSEFALVFAEFAVITLVAFIAESRKRKATAWCPSVPSFLTVMRLINQQWHYASSIRFGPSVRGPIYFSMTLNGSKYVSLSQSRHPVRLSGEVNSCHGLNGSHNNYCTLSKYELKPVLFAIASVAFNLSDLTSNPDKCKRTVSTNCYNSPYRSLMYAVVIN